MTDAVFLSNFEMSLWQNTFTSKNNTGGLFNTLKFYLFRHGHAEVIQSPVLHEEIQRGLETVHLAENLCSISNKDTGWGMACLIRTRLIRGSNLFEVYVNFLPHSYYFIFKMHGKFEQG